MKSLIANVSGARTFRELKQIWCSYFAYRGVDQLNYSHYPPFGARDFGGIRMILSQGYPRDWHVAYAKAGYINRDPVLQRILNVTRPVWFSDVEALPDLSEEEKTYFDLMRACKIGDHLALPVFGPAGCSGGFGVIFSPDTPKPSPDCVEHIHWLCQRTHIRYCELLVQNLEQVPTMSRRELEVLSSIARGRTNAQIARELSVTTKTVDTYLARVFHKFDVSDRMTAALRAIAMGLID